MLQIHYLTQLTWDEVGYNRTEPQIELVKAWSFGEVVFGIRSLAASLV